MSLQSTLDTNYKGLSLHSLSDTVNVALALNVTIIARVWSLFCIWCQQIKCNNEIPNSVHIFKYGAVAVLKDLH